MAARYRIIAVLFFLLPTTAIAQSIPETPQPKRFLDTETRLELASSAAAISTDALSTMKVMAYKNVGFNEPNPIARPFMNNRATAGAYFAAGFALETTGMYIAHRKHWRKTQRIIPIAVTVAEFSVAWANYRWVSRQSHANNCFIHGFNQGICP